jgi:hypothetical protein
MFVRKRCRATSLGLGERWNAVGFAQGACARDCAPNLSQPWPGRCLKKVMTGSDRGGAQVLRLIFRVLVGTLAVAEFYGSVFCVFASAASDGRMGGRTRDV